MINLYVSVPIACFRPGEAREFWETHPLPPPATVYGFLLAMVGEVNRDRHIGVRCTAGLLNYPDCSTVLRKFWRIKELGGKGSATQGNGTNVRPDYQHLLTNVKLVIIVDSTDEESKEVTLESRVRIAVDPKQRSRINRFGGLSMGESTHMVDEVCLVEDFKNLKSECLDVYLKDAIGNLTLPVWVDHVGRAKTRYVTGRIESLTSMTVQTNRIPRIEPIVSST
jgi:CRISPR-associated protein Cas5t